MEYCTEHQEYRHNSHKATTDNCEYCQLSEAKELLKAVIENHGSELRYQFFCEIRDWLLKVK